MHTHILSEFTLHTHTGPTASHVARLLILSKIAHKWVKIQDGKYLFRLEYAQMWSQLRSGLQYLRSEVLLRSEAFGWYLRLLQILDHLQFCAHCLQFWAHHLQIWAIWAQNWTDTTFLGLYKAQNGTQPFQMLTDPHCWSPLLTYESMGQLPMLNFYSAMSDSAQYEHPSDVGWLRPDHPMSPGCSTWAKPLITEDE